MEIIKTKSTDGIEFFGLYSRSKDSKKVIIQIHGMAGSVLNDAYDQQMHDDYPANGYSFVAGEHRGTGTVTLFGSDDGPVTIGDAYEKFEDCVYDIQGWVDCAVKLGYDEIWLQGHSMATSKIAFYITQMKPTNIAGIILLSPSDMVGLVKDPEGAKDHSVLYPEAIKLIKEGKREQLLSNKLWGCQTLSANTYINMFSDDSKSAIFNYFADDKWDVVNQINVPVLAITGTEDDGIATVMDSHKAMKKLEEELVSSPKVKTIVYDGAEHGFDGFESQITKDVLKFVSKIK